MLNRGHINYTNTRPTLTREDPGATTCPRDRTPPPVEWGRVYGGGPTLAQEAAALLAEGFAPEDAARELVARYGRQCECDARDLREAAEEMIQ